MDSLHIISCKLWIAKISEFTIRKLDFNLHQINLINKGRWPTTCCIFNRFWTVIDGREGLFAFYARSVKKITFLMLFFCTWHPNLCNLLKQTLLEPRWCPTCLLIPTGFARVALTVATRLRRSHVCSLQIIFATWWGHQHADQWMPLSCNWLPAERGTVTANKSLITGIWRCLFTGLPVFAVMANYAEKMRALQGDCYWFRRRGCECIYTCSPGCWGVLTHSNLLFFVIMESFFFF